MKNLFARILGGGDAEGCKKRHSYSQCGEDAILRFMFNSMRVRMPTYVDVGANDPIELSNTYLFYEQGCRGVCVEANPAIVDDFKKIRPDDRLLNVAVSPSATTESLEFYVMGNDVLSTLDKGEANRMVQEEGESIQQVVAVSVMTLNEIIDRECDDTPDFISLDVEGLDNQILAAFDFERCRPLAWCLETISYSATGQGTKDQIQRELLERNGYMLYADTYINSIFVDEERWKNRHQYR